MAQWGQEHDKGSNRRGYRHEDVRVHTDRNDVRRGTFVEAGHGAFFGHGLSSNAQKMLDRTIRCWPETELLFYDIFGKETGDDDTEWDGRHSVAMHAPLHISRLMNEGRVLYLDSGTITHADIGPLFDMDMKGCHIASARD